MFDMPVWMNSDGSSREYGLMPDPTKSYFCFETIAGPLSRGFPKPSKVLPSISSDTDIVAVSPRNFVKVLVSPSPIVDPKTCTTAKPSRVSSTCPSRSSPLASFISTISPYEASLTPSTNIRGPAILESVLNDTFDI